MTLPNLYGFVTKELAQDAAIASLLERADPEYSESHPRLHTLGTELLRSLLQTQEVVLPPIETLSIETQVDRIDIVVKINAGENGVLLIIEDRVDAPEGLYQIEGYKETAEGKYRGQYDRLVAVYLKTGNESKAGLPDKDKCGRFMRRDMLDVLNKFKDTGNTTVDGFRTYLQDWEDKTNKWESASYKEWEREQWEGFYVELEHRWNGCHRWSSIYHQAEGLFLGGWSKEWHIGTEVRYASLYIQIHDVPLHDESRLTVRVGGGNAMKKFDSDFIGKVLEALEKEAKEAFADIRIKKAVEKHDYDTARIANVTFDEQGPWFAVGSNGVVNMNATIERLHRLEELLERVATSLTEQKIVSELREDSQ